MTTRLADLADARVAIWGGGREARAALAALQRYFPRKALTVFCSEAEAQELAKAIVSPAALANDHGPVHERGSGSPASPALRLPAAANDPDMLVAPPTFVTTPPDVDALLAFDVVIKSPGISPYKQPAAAALRAGVRLVSGSALWFAEHAHARTICVTGTKGKSTVAALIAHVLRKSGKCVALAGNIGVPLLDLVGVAPVAADGASKERRSGVAPASGPPPEAGEEDRVSSPAMHGHATAPSMPPSTVRAVAPAAGSGAPPPASPSAAPDWWVVELSSFQTHDFGGAPTVAVINNLYEEHLDWHGSRERYAADKLAIGERAKHLVVAAQDELLARTAAHAQRAVFGIAAGWHVEGGAIRRGDERVLGLDELPLPGLHNALNACAALAAIEAAGFDAVALAPHVRDFRPLPHRLQPLGTRGGIDYVNDSIATTPYATIEALRSLRGRAVTVLVGGFDRGVDWQPFVDHVIAEPPHAIVTMGANGPAIAARLARIESPRFALAGAARLPDALEQARALASAGGIILLSPGAPSFDGFRDYAERGREFARLAGFDPQSIAQIEGLGIS